MNNAQTQDEDPMMVDQNLQEPLLAGHQELTNDSEAIQTHQQNGDIAEDTDGNNEEEPPPSWLGLLFFRFLYFFSGLSSSTWGRFGVIYYNDVKHFTPTQIGILEGIFPLIAFFSSPFWGVVSDCIRSRKAVFLFNKFVSTGFLLSLAFMDNNFYHILIAVVGMALFRASAVLDAHSIDFLGEAHRGLYGTIRMWAAVSWGLGAVIMGHLTDTYGFGINFWLFGGMSVIMFLVVAFGLPRRSKSEQEMYDNAINAETDDQHRPRSDTLKRALVKLPILWWFFEVAVIGGAIAIVESFLFVYLQNDLGASTVLCGNTVGITVLFELPIFGASKWFLRRIGHDGLFLIALLSSSLRVLGYSFLTPATSHWVLPIEVFHGITFACMWVASVDFSAAVSPPEWKTTVQSILSTVLNCIGRAWGPLVGGWIIKRFGFLILWRSVACMVGIIAVIHTLTWLCGCGHDAFLKKLEAGDNGGPPATVVLLNIDGDEQTPIPSGQQMIPAFQDVHRGITVDVEESVNNVAVSNGGENQEREIGGDPSRYDHLSWKELPREFRCAARVLGYTKTHWNTDKEPKTCKKSWRRLTPEQQQAARTYGYTRETWDKEDNQNAKKSKKKQQSSKPAQSNGAKPAPPTPDVEEPKRVPQAFTYYEALDWDELSDVARGAASVLGYDKQMWDGGQEPELSDEWWSSLTPDMRAAATLLGHNERTWNGSEGMLASDDWRSGSPEKAKGKGSRIPAPSPRSSSLAKNGDKNFESFRTAADMEENLNPNQE